MDYNSKEDFYDEIFKDYNENHTDSFLYKYLKSRKDRNLGFETYLSNKNKTRKDSYVYIQSCLKAYLEKCIEKTEMADVMEEISKDLTADEIFRILNKGDKDKLTKRELAEELKKKIKSEIGAETLPDDGITVMVINTLSGKYIDNDIWNFLYNIGYGKSSNVRRSAGGKKTQRRSDEALDMLFEYLKQKNNDGLFEDTDKKQGASDITAASSDRLDDDDYINECVKLYNILNKSKFDINDLIFVPLMIDPDTGMGLYIAGGDILMRSDNDKMNCYYCCIRFDYEGDDAFFGEYIPDHYGESEHKFKMSYSIDDKSGKFTDIGEAIDEYKRLKKYYEDYSGYEMVNWTKSKPVEDSGMETFLRYFLSSDEVSGIIKKRREEKLRRYQKGRSIDMEGKKREEAKKSR